MSEHKRIMVEGLGVLNGEVEYTQVVHTESVKSAVVIVRDEYERMHGEAAGTMIKFTGFEQAEYIAPTFDK